MYVILDPQLCKDKRQPEMAVEVGGELLQGISDPDSKEVCTVP